MSKSNDSSVFSLHKFHILNSEKKPMNTVSLWAEDWKDAIKTFRGMNPGVQFMTDVEYNVRRKQATEVKVEDKKAA